MQISMPTDLGPPADFSPPQAQSPVQESSFGENHAVWSRKAQKKNSGGFFAKLLEGLTAKLKTDNPKGALGSKDAEREVFPHNMGKNTLQNIKHSINSEMGQDFFPDGSVSGGVPFILWQNNLSAGQNAGQMAGAQSEKFRSVRKESANGFFTAGNFRPEANLKEDGLPVPGAGKGEDQRNAASGALLSRPEKGERAAASGGAAGAEKAKTPAEAGLRAAAASNEAGSFQAQLRNDFANQLRPESNERDNTLSLKSQGKKGRERLGAEARSDRLHANAPEAQDAAKPEISKVGSFDAVKRTEIELPVNLNLRADRCEEAAGKTGKDLSMNSRFEDALARELRGNLSADIVREAAVIVRGAGEGTIRLSLRPASLGDVKIRLEMAENKITGHIILQSSEALRAFERELPVLEKAFKDSGFSETNLEMSLAQDGGEYGAKEQGQEGDFQALSPLFAASRYEAESDWVEEPAAAIFQASAERKAVNLLV